jgi:hypothetical protein
MKPQTIQIFLPDGSPISIKEAELTNRLVKAVKFPRNKIQEVSKRELVHYTGVYFLFGLKYLQPYQLFPLIECIMEIDVGIECYA